MADESQIVDDALSALSEIRRAYSGQPIAELAGLMSEQIRPTMAFDEEIEKRKEAYENTPERFVEEAIQIAAKRGPTYKTPVFQCLSDFEKCKKHTSSKGLCRAALAICVGKQLIPFVKHT